MVTVIRRKEWGATAGDGIGPRPAQYAVPDEAWLHHSVTTQLPSSATKAQEAAQMRVVESIGVQRFGRAYGFPYTFGAFPSGRVYEGHAYGKVGAHTGGSNSRGIGICWVGNYDVNAKPTKALIRSTAELLVQLWKAGKLKQPRLNGGHRDSKRATELYGPTACPGRHAHAVIGEVNALAAQLAKGGSGSTPKPPPSSGGSSGTDSLGRYTVRSGDTLGELAVRFRTSVGALALLNGITNPDRIEVGQKLYTAWVVGRGDTLGKIARQARTTVARLVSINGIKNPDQINVGQLIRLP